MDRAGSDAAVDATRPPRRDAGHDAGPPPELQLPPSSRSLADLIGIASHPGDLPVDDSPAAAARREFYFRKLGELGIHRLRRDFRWYDIEPERGMRDFGAYDRLVDGARAAGIDVLATLGYGTPWASADPAADDYYPPANDADFAQFAAATTAHFAGRVQNFEIWNEPNVGFRFWKPIDKGDPVAFAALVAATVGAVHEANPDAVVAYGGTAFLPQLITGGVDFARQSFTAEPALPGALGAFAMHAYNLYPPTYAPESIERIEVPLPEKVYQMAAMLDGTGFDVGNKPIWITEIGWPASPGPRLEQTASYLVRSVLLAALAGGDSIYIYTLGDTSSEGANAFVQEAFFGLTNYDADYGDGIDPADKPAFSAIKGLVAILGTMHVVGRVPSPDDAGRYVIALGNGERRAFAAWHVGGIGAGARLHLSDFDPPITAATIYNRNGAPIAQPAEGNLLSESPVYVVERAP